ncbi:uncharacterized protein EV154DRAFT_556013 [Mucor mucedo]|uniref:uncharacterized protein n=1 Tax=Mucor mucedo TaxID=29922 RepID=UPI00222059CB|nr:uncharacterized protein EV154DRAFT_556013 [Mucor mucedo]KAI7874339.1 hypothetical protein EV154DRAFT_556013 [Mucor mucedo]
MFALRFRQELAEFLGFRLSVDGETVNGSVYTVNGSEYTVNGSEYTVNGSDYTVNGSDYTNYIERNAYIKKTDIPIFSDFVLKNSTSLMAWSKDKVHMDAKQLYSLWRNRFALSLRSENKLQLICESKNHFEKELWERIRKGAQSLLLLKVSVPTVTKTTTREKINGPESASSSTTKTSIQFWCICHSFVINVKDNQLKEKFKEILAYCNK